MTATGCVREVAPAIWRVEHDLAPGIGLAIHVVAGDTPVLIDTGIASSYDTVHLLLSSAGISPRAVRLVLNTHGHHDHIGCNRRIKEDTGALLGAPAGAVAWIEDHDRHLRQFAFHHPDLIPADDAAVAELAATMDGSTRVDVVVDEGFTVRGSDAIALRAFFLPGHVEAEVGFFESRSRTLLLGDALPSTGWSLFHGHVRPAVLRRTLRRLAGLTSELGVERVCLAHYPVLGPDEFLERLADVERFVDDVDAVVRATIRDRDVSLAEVWEATYRAFGKEREFRGLAMVEAHVAELRDRGLVVRSGPDRFRWAAPAPQNSEPSSAGAFAGLSTAEQY